MDLETNTSGNRAYSAAAWLWGVPLFALFALAILLATDSNIVLFKFLNRLTQQASDSWWTHLTMLGDTSLALMFILPLLGRKPTLVWQFTLAALMASAWSHGMKALFSSLRPPAVLQEGSYHLIGPMLQHNSFPSGHTTTIFLLAGLCCLRFINNRLKLMVLVLALLVGLSRIACGVHWPADVIGGAFGGWLSASAGTWLGRRWDFGLNIWFQRILAVFVTLSAIWTLVYYNSGFPDTRLFQFVITVACLVFSAKWQYQLFKSKHSADSKN